MVKIIAGLALVGSAWLLQDGQTPPPSSAAPIQSTTVANAIEGMTIIPVRDLSQSKAFYEKLGCRVEISSPRFAVVSSSGIRLRLVPSVDISPSSHPVVVWRFPRNSKMHELFLTPGVQQMDAGAPTARMVYQSFTGYESSGGVVKGYVMKDPDGHVIAILEADADK